MVIDSGRNAPQRHRSIEPGDIVSGFLGADTEALRGHAQLLQDRSTAIEELRARLEPMVMDEGTWVGPDADHFRSEWTSRAGARLTTSADELRTWGTDLSGQADEQDQTSDPEGGGSGGSGGGGAGAGGGEGGPSLLDRIMGAGSLYNKVQSLFTKGKKVWDLVGIVSRAVPAIAGATDPLVKLMGYGEYGRMIAANVFNEGKEFGKIVEKLMGKTFIPSGFLTKSPWSGVDDLVKGLSKAAPFLDTITPWIGKAAPGLDIVFGGMQAIEGFSSGDTFHGVTGTVSAVGGGLMLAGGALSATGVGAVIGGPMAAIGAGLSLGAAAADLGKMAYDNWPQISATAGQVWDGASDLVGGALDAIFG